MSAGGFWGQGEASNVQGIRDKSAEVLKMVGKKYPKYKEPSEPEYSGTEKNKG